MIETLGPYKILDRIGAGGIGEVYRARDTRHGRTVAIKVVAAEIADNPARREQLLSDARRTATLSHPNIATLYEVSEDEGRLFLVFDFVPGETLKAIIAARSMNPRRALDVAAQTGDALAEAHAAGLVHHDIKPDNIIVTPRGNAKILDYGLAAWTTGGRERHPGKPGDGSDSPSLTTPYLSPEQVLGEQEDERSDIFSLGVVLFEMLTGRTPFLGQTRSALELQIMQTSAPMPSSINASSPPELDPIVTKALAKSIDQRYISAATLAAELRSVAAILDVRSGANDQPETAVGAPPTKRSVIVWIGLAFAVGALGAAVWLMRIR